MTHRFLLGLGAQKAGTTWMFGYLRQHPECAMGTIKEHAVLSTLVKAEKPGGRFKKKISQVETLLAAVRKESAEGKVAPTTRRRLLDRMATLGAEFDADWYFDYFRRLCDAMPDCRLVGDITPAYAWLDAGELKAARKMLERRGYDARVVFLMRDPVERCYSALRMQDRIAREAGRTPARPAAARFVEDATSPWCATRTRYERTIAAIDGAFAPDQVHLAFYEEFISRPGADALCDFLGISRHPPDLDHRPNASPSPAALTAGQIAQVRAFYNDTYRYCADRFGTEKIRRLWRNYDTR